VCKLGYVVVPRNVLAIEHIRDREVLLKGRLKSALLRINPWLANDGADRAIFKLDANTLAHRGLLRWGFRIGARPKTRAIPSNSGFTPS
jgi:hypothetical protein